jgi:hypothetical protein
MKAGSKLALLAAVASAGLLSAGMANASLSVFQQYVGTNGISTDGWGSTTNTGNITASVPVGSTVLAAYLYSSMFFDLTVPTGTLNGATVNYATQLGSTGGCCSLQASRANVTSIVKPVIDSGPGGIYNFAITEGKATQDGEALVVVYSNATLPTSTIAILNGFSAQAGDNSSISFATGLNPAAAGFQAEMRIGDGFSCCGQKSVITVNGQTLTNVAGNHDDGLSGDSNGALITVGGSNDPFTVASPGTPANDYATDHERYDLRPYITAGDTTINIHTVNPSNDDNIFLEVFQVTGEGRVTTGPGVIPEPTTWAMLIAGIAGLGAMLRRRRATGPLTA